MVARFSKTVISVIQEIFNPAVPFQKVDDKANASIADLRGSAIVKNYNP
jgi:hypothetical protein